MDFKFHDFGPRGQKTDDTFLLGDTVYDGEHQVFVCLEMTPEQVERRIRDAMAAYVNKPLREGLIIKQRVSSKELVQSPITVNLNEVVYPALARGKINLFE